MKEGDGPFTSWVGKARHVLLNIENNIDAEQVPWDTVCFHAQQAVEKMLKAFLAYNEEIPPRTHDLVALLTQCLPFEPKLSELEKDCRDLTYFAVGS